MSSNKRALATTAPVIIDSTPDPHLGAWVRLRPGCPFADELAGDVGRVLALWEPARRDDDGAYGPTYQVVFPLLVNGRLIVRYSYSRPSEWVRVAAPTDLVPAESEAGA